MNGVRNAVCIEVYEVSLDGSGFTIIGPCQVVTR